MDEMRTETLPTLRNISFTLPKVCFTTDNGKGAKLDWVKGKHIFSVLFPEGKPAWCLWERGEWKDITDLQHFGTGWLLLSIQVVFFVL